MKHILVLLTLSVLLFSCGKDKVRLHGKVSNQKSSNIILEKRDLSHRIFVDSVQLKDGEFSFSFEGDVFPEFYNLNIDGKRIPFIVDSIMEISFDIDMSKLHEYKVHNSHASQRIQDMNKLILEARRKMNKALAMSDEIERNRSYNTAFKNLQDTIGLMINTQPMCFSSYYGVFSKVDGHALYDPIDRDENRYYATVANSLRFVYPDHYRSKHVYEHALLNIEKRKRMILQEQLLQAPSSVPELKLPDVKGDSISLRGVLENQPILLVFWSYLDANYPGLFEDLTYLKKKYASRGLQIYQVSLDSDIEEWGKRLRREKSDWIQVNDVWGAAGYACKVYNVQTLPFAYALGLDADVVRPQSMSREDLEKSIVSVLKK